MSKGWLVHKGIYSNHSCKKNMVERQRDALLRAGLDFDYIDVFEASRRLTTCSVGTCTSDANDIELPDWVLFRNPDLELRHALEVLGVVCVNSYETACICRDKYLTAAFCARNGIPHPVTVKAPSVKSVGEHKEDIVSIVEETIGFPAVMKGSFGSGGMGVIMAEDRGELLELLPDENRNRIIQELIDTSWGRDARLFVVDGKVIYSHERVNTDGDFRSNEAQGGHCRPHEATDAERELAEKVGRTLPNSAISVDVMWDEDGNPILCEMNGNPDFSDIDDSAFSNPVFENSIAAMIVRLADEIDSKK